MSLNIDFESSSLSLGGVSNDLDPSDLNDLGESGDDEQWRGSCTVGGPREIKFR